MYEKKTMLGIRVYNFANQYGIQKSTVHTIINSYIDYCKELLLKGIKVDFLGLCSLVPDYKVDSFNRTLAYDCKILSDILGLPTHTVFVVINEYLMSIKDEVLSGKPASIRGIVTLKPIYVEDTLTKVHSSISLSLKKLIEERNTLVSSIRVHTSKILKFEVKGSGLNEFEA